MEEAISFFSNEEMSDHLKQRYVKQVGDQVPCLFEKQEITNGSSSFVLSKGCPIKYLANSEATEVPEIMFAPNYEDAIDEEANLGVTAEGDPIQLTYPVQESNMHDHFQGASKFICTFYETLRQSIEYLHVFHVLSAMYNHVMHYLLIKKGCYFAKPVNSFV